MNRNDIIARLKSVEPALRARGVLALYLFGSHSRDEARVNSDLDVFVEPADDRFYDLSNFMGAYGDLVDAFPNIHIGYSTRDGLAQTVRLAIEQDAIRVF